MRETIESEVSIERIAVAITWIGNRFRVTDAPTRLPREMFCGVITLPLPYPAGWWFQSAASDSEVKMLDVMPTDFDGP